MRTLLHGFAYCSALVLALAFAACSHKEPGGDPQTGDIAGALKTQAAAATDYYTCPMHPSIRSDKPGVCPVCGMALVRGSAEAAYQADTSGLRRISLSPAQRIIANVSTVPAVRRTLSSEINAVGIVAVAEPAQATVAARFRGRIEKLHVDVTGQHVRKGDALFELYSPDLITAERDFLLALQAGNQTSSADAAGMSSMQRQLLDASRDRLKVHFGSTDEQIAQLISSGRIRNTVTFFSPISGTVLQKDIQQGMYVEEGMTLYQLADLSTVWAYLDVYEKDLRFIKVGQTVGVTTEAYPGKTFTGRVAFVDPVVNPGTRTVRVRTEFENKQGLLKPNMYVRAHMTAPAAPSVVLPRSAVLSTGPRTVVWVEIASNQFEPREVALGAADSGQVEIIRGIREGENVVQTGGFLIDSESSLQEPAPADLYAAREAAETAARQDKEPGTPRAESRVTIVVDGQYNPDIVRIPRDVPVKLDFYRKDGSACTNEVVFGDLRLRRTLPRGKTTTIELPPQKPGEIHFTCGMGMLHGTVVVE